MKKKKFAGIIFVFLFIILSSGCTEINGDKNFIEKNSVSIGDFVEIYFIAEYLTNGSIYDSTFIDIKNKTVGDPLKIFVSNNTSHHPPDGYEEYSHLIDRDIVEALIDMRKGQTKTINVIPSEIEKMWSTELALEYGQDKYPINSVLNFEIVDNKSNFDLIFPDTNLSIGSFFDYGFLSIGIKDVLYASIIDISGSNITYRVLPIDGTTITHPFFNWKQVFIVENTENYTIQTITEIGHVFSQYNQFDRDLPLYVHYSVVDMDDEYIYFGIIEDYYGEIAKELIKYNIEIHKIYEINED